MRPEHRLQPVGAARKKLSINEVRHHASPAHPLHTANAQHQGRLAARPVREGIVHHVAPTRL
jgi:hypothetical protein